MSETAGLRQPAAEVAHTLNAEGIPARRGRWPAQTVARALDREPA